MENMEQFETTEQRDAAYNQYIKTITPKNSLIKDLCAAFLVGGLICLLGQFIQNMLIKTGMPQEDASTYTSICLIGLSVILTALHQFSKIAKFGGAGALVPITGFANSVAACAQEFKAEGQVFGVGSKIFSIAGPVILYGVFTSWVLGLIYWLLP
jgi:stage V sporulation protein AC